MMKDKKGHLIGDYQDHRILDYEQMNDRLDHLKICIEQKEIGRTTFDYPIRHFTFGNGPYHAILTAGTHAVELITNCFLIQFMEYLEANPEVIDQVLYITFYSNFKSRRYNCTYKCDSYSDSKRNDSFWEELFCIQYYMNAKVEDDYVLNMKDQDTKLQMWMFRYATPDCIDKKHEKLKKSIQRIIQEQDLPKGVMAQWSSNGVGIDLNANVWHPRYEKE